MVDGPPVDAEETRAAVGQLTTDLQRLPDVTSVVNAYTTPDPRLRATDGRASLIVITIRKTDDVTVAHNAVDRVRAAVRGQVPGASIRVGGEVGVSRDQTKATQEDLFRGELIALPILLLALLHLPRTALRAAAGVRGARHERRRVAATARRDLHHRRLDLRGRRGHSVRAGACRRLQPSDGQPVPRGTRGRPGSGRGGPADSRHGGTHHHLLCAHRRGIAGRPIRVPRPDFRLSGIGRYRHRARGARRRAHADPGAARGVGAQDQAGQARECS